MKGKGHEFSDVARLLNFYQLWLDGLYPRAKFADGLQLVEKVGHSKRMQVMRKEWIDEGKPGYIKPGTELVESILRDDGPLHSRAGENGQLVVNPTRPDTEIDGNDMFFASPSKTNQNQAASRVDPDDDELDALMAMQDSAPALHTTNGGDANAEDSEGDDDLDALLAEQDSRRADHAKKPEPSTEPEDDEDDLDALLAEQEAQEAPSLPQPQQASSSRPSSRDSASKKKRTIFDDSDSEDEDDLAVLPAQKPIRKTTPPTSPLPVQDEGAQKPEPDGPEKMGSQKSATKVFSSSPIRNDGMDKDMKAFSSSPMPNNPEEEDDLDALLAEAGM